ncbi:hypothetical protein [Legionella drancourtii]|uniref:Uncharacterized protein n=1 Tax=Legionella drancourtii LLAP12 TaxID=658187 RepID=G9EL12_9GAMM|nr:hypothetical protein [Legionella drancourtii]EHL32025.1 hypothetical protein LDG_5908 [Legionella drancourtii LLAP12]
MIAYEVHKHSPIEVINKAIVANNFKLIDKINDALVDKKLPSLKSKNHGRLYGLNTGKLKTSLVSNLRYLIRVLCETSGRNLLIYRMD